MEVIRGLFLNHKILILSILVSYIIKNICEFCIIKQRMAPVMVTLYQAHIHFYKPLVLYDFY